MEFKYSTIVEAVLDHGKTIPDKPAVCFKKQVVTYKQLADYITAGAKVLSENYGVAENDYVMITAISKPEYVVTSLAVQYLGAVAISLDKSALDATNAKLADMVKPRLFITDKKVPDGVRKLSLRQFYGEVQEAASAGGPVPEYKLPDPEKTAEIIFTTGTTGTPKGAMLSYKNTYTSTVFTIKGVHRTPDCVELLPLPLNHSFGLRVLRALLYLGATVILQNGFMFPMETETNIREYKCNGICIVPASAEKLYQNMGDRFAEIFSPLEYMEVSAGSLSVGMKQRLLAVIPTVHLYNVWGSSETGSAIFLDVTNHPEHIASLGQPMEGVEIRMLDPEGNIYVANSAANAGRMIMKGDMNMKGYFELPDVTAETIADGYLRTGDLAYMTEDGFVYMLGRADDLIKVGGENVSPVEVENVASMYDGIRECVVIGVDDPEGVLGQVPALYYVRSGMDFDEKKCSDFMQSKLELFKLPKVFVEISELPRNRLKKIDRKALKKMWANRGDEVERTPVVSAILDRRSVRDFTDREIPREILEQLALCGTYAPCGHNLQNWKFTIVRKAEEIAKIKELCSTVAKRTKTYFYGFNNPTALILVSCDTRDPYGIQDSSAAAENIMLAAHSHGIGSVWINVLMKICDEPEIRELLTSYGIPASHNVWAMLAMGYPSNKPSVLAKKPNTIGWVE